MTPIFFIYGNEKIEFSIDELEKETVLPIFNSRDVIKDRIIKTKNRLELHLGVGWNTTEALYKNFSYTGNVSFHINDLHAINLLVTFIPPGLSMTGKTLTVRNNFDFSRVPYPQSLSLLQYKFKAYYGKISLSKKIVMNLFLYTLIGGGGVLLSDQKFVPSGSIGIGKKFYLTRRVSLRFDILFFIHKNPDFTSVPNVDETSETGFIPHEKYKQIWSDNLYMSLGFGFLF